MQPLNLTLVIVFLNVVFTDLSGQSSEFYGMTYDGGEYNIGSIFKTDHEGNNLHLLFSFESINMGSMPTGQLCESLDGKLYGVTFKGGLNDVGTLFEWDPSVDTFTKRFDFSDASNGYHPSGSLVLTDSGIMLGMTSDGGKYNKGVLYKWDPISGIYTKLLDFNGEENGSSPRSLLKAKNGRYYGLTSQGGSYSNGVLFEWDQIEEKYIKKHDFLGGAMGDSPYCTLIQASDDLLYGVTWNGGVNGDGVLFAWDPDGEILTKKFDFDDIEYGREPQGSLLQCSNGKIYGMTSSGGVYDMGVFYEWDPVSNVFKKLIDFNGSEKGRYPYGSLCQGDSTKIYGLTTFGGEYGHGVFFEWDIAYQLFNKKLDFNAKETGAYPNFLNQTNSGKYFVTTIHNDIDGGGTIIECDPAHDIFKRKQAFIDKRADNGKNPVGTLVQADNGKLYGLTNQGGIKNDSAAGAYSNGVLFEFDPVTLTYVKKFDFDMTEYGGKPVGQLVKANNGKLYGMTPRGGIYYDPYSGYVSHGVLFEWNPDVDSFNVMHKFNGTEGSYPQGSLIKATNGLLYGMTSDGGIYGYGVIFEYDCNTNTYSKRFDFDLNNTGGDPRGTLMEASNGKLYGITFSGGEYEHGVLFEWVSDSNKFSKLFDFSNTDGKYPGGTLVQANNGKLYGLTAMGGEFDMGVLFEFDPNTNIFNKKIDFSNIYGGSPYGSLIHGSNDRLYGFTRNEENNSLGVFFEWNTQTDSFIIKHDFREKIIERSNNLLQMEKLILKTNFASLKYFDPLTCDGSYFSTSLIEIENKTYSNVSVESCEYYTSPSGKYLWSISGVYWDTIPNMSGGDSIITVNLTIRNHSTNTISTTACNYYISPSGKIWTETSEYEDIIPNFQGCDSIITVNLLITKVDTSVTQTSGLLTANADEATYQWIDCDNGNAPIEGENNQTYTATIDGNYAVIVSENGCTDTSACFFVNSTDIIENTFEHNISLYPNPNDGSFSIDMGNVYSAIVVTIMSPDGWIIQRIKSNNVQIIDLKLDAPSGIYLTTISSEKGRAVFKIVKY